MDHIVVGDRVLPDASFGAARARLRTLARDGMLLRASEAAYGEGITGLVQAAGPAAGLTRLAGICLEDRAETGDCAHIALQWEAIAADGTLFTALDAALLLVPAGDQGTALTLSGAYRPQAGPAGAGLDQKFVRRCATAATSSFLDRVAGALVHPAGTPAPRPGTTESYSSTAAGARQARAEAVITPAGACAPPATAAPGTIAGPAAGYGILDPLVLIFAVSVLLAGLLTGLITAVRRRHARRLMPAPAVALPPGDAGPPRLALLAGRRILQARLFPGPPGQGCLWSPRADPSRLQVIRLEVIRLVVRGRHALARRDSGLCRNTPASRGQTYRNQALRRNHHTNQPDHARKQQTPASSRSPSARDTPRITRYRNTGNTHAHRGYGRSCAVYFPVTSAGSQPPAAAARAAAGAHPEARRSPRRAGHERPAAASRPERNDP
jgi:hypothetical protein